MKERENLSILQSLREMVSGGTGGKMVGKMVGTRKAEKIVEMQHH